MPRTFETSSFVVAIGDQFFLGKDDWTENPTYAKKYSKVKQAEVDAEAERYQHPSTWIRVVRLYAVFEVSELAEDK